MYTGAVTDFSITLTLEISLKVGYCILIRFTVYLSIYNSDIACSVSLLSIIVFSVPLSLSRSCTHLQGNIGILLKLGYAHHGVLRVV